MSLIAELKRRKVFKVGGAYLVAGWLAIQVATSVLPLYGTPDWFLRAFVLVVLLGFPIALVMAWVFDITPEGVKLDAASTGSKRVFAASAVLIAFVLGWYFHGMPVSRNAAKSPSASAAPAAVAADSHSIAVLPFVDMSQAKDQEYFSDGLSEELLNLLAQVPQLRVIARTSSFSFKGKEVDVATIAKALNVANVLEGSVRKSGNTLRITAQLIRTSDSSHLWSQTYDRELTDIFKVQDEIANAVVSALKVQLLPDQTMTNTHRSSNAEAYNQFLLGNEFYARMNPENWRRAIDAYQQAITLDGHYAAAYAALASSEGRLADNLGDAALSEQALATADKAISLAPELADGYVSRGTMWLAYRRDWGRAQADFDKALALNAGDSNVQLGRARLLIALGRLPEAIAALRKAVELDPLAGDSWAQLGRMLNASGQLPLARQALSRALEITPESDFAHFHLGETDLLEGKPQDALALYQHAGNYGPAGVAMAEYSLGHAKESQQALDEQIAKYAQGSAYQVAEIYAWRGEKDKAFEWLDRAYAQHDGGLSFIKNDPLIAKLRGDPRYAAMLKKLGLPE